MRVRMLSSFAGPSVDWPAGTVQEVPDAEVKRLIEAGHAVPADAEKPETTRAKKPAREAR